MYKHAPDGPNIKIARPSLAQSSLHRGLDIRTARSSLRKPSRINRPGRLDQVELETRRLIRPVDDVHLELEGVVGEVSTCFGLICGYDVEVEVDGR